MASLILGIYNILANLLIWPLCFYVRRHPNFKGTLPQRLARKLPQVPAGDLIWFHGASMGEVKAVALLIETLKARRPDCCICLSSMTATGRQAAEKIHGVDFILPMPFDLAWVMRRYLKRLKPRVLVIVETEIWPNFLNQARKAGVRTLFVNARISEKTFRRYQLVRPLMTKILSQTSILAIAAEDASRFKVLGAPHAEVFGNLKFDTVQSVDRARSLAVRRTLQCGERPVFIAGSIREGEEKLVMDAIRDVRSRIPELFCMVAPRHSGSIPILIDLAQSAGLSWTLRSKSADAADLLFIDTMGELFDLYGTAQVAFVGGSLVPTGGQNILEPIAWSVPTIHGPHMENFLWAMDILKGHTLLVETASGLGRAVTEVLTDPIRYEAISRRAREALVKAQGATGRYVDKILE